jgi:hypothetical protein
VSSQLITYYSDQFPLRNAWVSIHALGELGALRGESNGVLVGQNGQLAVRRFDAYLSRFERLENTDVYSPAHVEKGLKTLIALDEALSAKGIPLCVLLAPRTIDVTAGDFAYPSDISDRLDATIRTTLGDAKINSVELLDTFRELHDAGEYVYYRTDHHWTTKGAYLAYTAVMDSWPHMHIDMETPDGRRADLAPYIGLPDTSKSCTGKTNAKKSKKTKKKAKKSSKKKNKKSSKKSKKK